MRLKVRKIEEEVAGKQELTEGGCAGQLGWSGGYVNRKRENNSELLVIFGVQIT